MFEYWNLNQLRMKKEKENQEGIFQDTERKVFSD